MPGTRVFKRGLSYPDAIREDFGEVGQPTIIATLVLMGGFSMLSFSKLWPTTKFGLMVTLCCFLALVAELLLTPALLLKFKPFKPAGRV